MRVGLVLGITSLATAFAIGEIHRAYTGDASVLQLAARGLVFAAVISFLMTLRLGMPLSLRLALARTRRG